MKQVQSSPYTTNPNPTPAPPPLAVQSTANSAPGAQTQASTPGTTTPAIQQANPQMPVSTPQPSMPHFMQPGVTSPSARQGPMLPTSRMGTYQRPNADGSNPWQMPASSWNQQHGGPRFADGGFNPSGGDVRGNPPPGVLEQIIRALSPPVRPTGAPPFNPPPGRAHGGMAPQVHEQGALGALAPDMTNPPDHMGNSRPNYTGNMTQSSGRADDINAKLANNEYIMDAETTALAGDGNPDEGARRFDKLREEIRKHKGKALAKGKISPNAKPRLSAYNPEMVR
jgi:hypothetical protein